MYLKKYFLLALVLVIAMGGIGCNRSKKSAVDSKEIRVLNYFDLTTAGAQDELRDVWQAFDTANPDIKVNREDLFNEPFHQKTEAYAAANQVPDVLYAWPSGRSTTLHTQKLLKDLGPLIQKDDYGRNFTPIALDPSQQAAGYVAIMPQAITQTHALYVNTKVLREAGLSPAKTYEELKAQVPVLKAKGLQTILMANQDTWVMQSCLFSMLAGRFGGPDWEKRILGGQAKFTDPDFVKALEFVQTLYTDGVLDRATITTDYGSVIGQFATGKGAYLIDGDWRVGAFIRDASTGQALIPIEAQADILITVFPDIPGAKINKSTSGVLGTGWGISAAVPAGSAREAAAWEMVKWLTSKEILTWRIKRGAFSTSSRTDLGVISGLEPMQVAASKLTNEYDYSTAVIDGVFEGPVYTPLNDGLQLLGMGQITPAQVAQQTQAAYDAWQSQR